MPLIIIFFIIPLAEVYAFLNVGEEIGVFKTLLLCVLTAMIGGFLVRRQGLGTLLRAQSNLKTGKMPINDIFNGFCIVIAGALLLTPGFVTDTIGFLLLFPPFRVFLQHFLSKNTHFTVKSAQYSSKNTDNGIIDGDYERVEKDAPPLEQSPKED